MKYTNSFDMFLENKVNLNPTRIDRIKDGIATVETFIKNNEMFKDHFIKIVPQGSYRQKTIIKPLDGDGDFDVDILLELKEFTDWSAKQYLDALHNEFKNTDRYKNIVDRRGKNRCVTLDYADDFHIDIIPSIRTATGTVIMNRETDSFEPTDGDGYAQWFERANSLSTNNFLVKVVRLTKYLRDREVMPIKSIMLTTIIGGLVFNSDTRTLYSDLPTAFRVLFGLYDDYLQSHSGPFDVKNPVLPIESFTRHWDQDNFDKTKGKVHDLRIKIDEAYDAEDVDESLELWQEVFGDAFQLSDVDAPVASIEKKSLTVSINGLQLADFSHKQELVDAHILPGNSLSAVRIEADLHWGRGDTPLINRRHLGPFTTKTEIPKYHWLKYRAVTTYNKPYDVYWQVVNTGEHAERLFSLRGKIFKDDGSEEQWERSLYTGVHWMECFVVDQATNACVCRSGPFYVGFRDSTENVPG